MNQIPRHLPAAAMPDDNGVGVLVRDRADRPLHSELIGVVLCHFPFLP